MDRQAKPVGSVENEPDIALIDPLIAGNALDRSGSQPVGHVAEACHLLAVLGDNAANLFM